MPKSKNKLEELFSLADSIGGRRYHRLTAENFEDYRKFDHWRYVCGDYECGTTDESRQWVRDNSCGYCPICDKKFSGSKGPTIDHKLPRSQYPWLSLEFQNLWVICLYCNREKGERHWYEYEHYILTQHENRYDSVRLYRPKNLIEQLKE